MPAAQPGGRIATAVLTLSEGGSVRGRIGGRGTAAMGRLAAPGRQLFPGSPARAPHPIPEHGGWWPMHLCPECCRGHRTADVVEMLGIAEVLRRLDRIERAINSERKLMASIDEALDALGTQLDALGADLARELQDLVTAIGGQLNTDQQAKVDALAGRLTDLQASIDTADPTV